MEILITSKREGKIHHMISMLKSGFFGHIFEHNKSDHKLYNIHLCKTYRVSLKLMKCPEIELFMETQKIGEKFLKKSILGRPEIELLMKEPEKVKYTKESILGRPEIELLMKEPEKVKYTKESILGRPKCILKYLQFICVNPYNSDLKLVGCSSHLSLCVCKL